MFSITFFISRCLINGPSVTVYFFLMISISTYHYKQYMFLSFSLSAQLCLSKISRNRRRKNACWRVKRTWRQ